MRESSLSWQKILAQGFKSASELLMFLNLPVSMGDQQSEQQFSTRVPLSFAERMQKGNPLDPLLLQVLATQQELMPAAAYNTDPLDESHHNPVPGLIHKYHGRVLLTVTGVCAVNCRYCFRRHFPYQQNNPGREGFNKIIDYINNDSNIKEVILSGGDPLLASDTTLKELIQKLEQIPHVITLRIHTRIPVVLPERIDTNFMSLLSTTPLKKVIVLHCNHPQELNNSAVKIVLKSLVEAQCVLLNQSVLLAGINDNPDVLASLSYRLFDNHILPYYLHILDKVQGAAHFDLDIQKVRLIYQQLQELVPGYLLPRLVQELSGKLSKIQII